MFYPLPTATATYNKSFDHNIQMILNIKVCTDGQEWRLKIVGQILEAKMLNGSSFHNQPDSPVMVLGQLLLAPFLDTEMENKLGIMPVFFTKKGLSYQV